MRMRVCATPADVVDEVCEPSWSVRSRLSDDGRHGVAAPLELNVRCVRSTESVAAVPYTGPCELSASHSASRLMGLFSSR